MRFLRLQSRVASLILTVPAAGLPEVLYWGPALPADTEADALAAALARPLPHAKLDRVAPLSLLAEAAGGTLARPGIEGHRDGQAWMAGFDTTSIEADDHRAVLHARDHRAELDLVMTLVLDDDSGVLRIDTQLTNIGTGRYQLDWLSAAALPVPADCDEVLSLEGRWCGEFQTRRFRPPQGLWARENRAGRTSHEGPPALILGRAGFGEHHGLVYGFHLGWSGNHRILAEKLWDGSRVVQMGELPLPGEIALEPGACYAAPPLYAAVSDRGLTTLSRRLHDYLRRAVVPIDRDRPRPVLINTWEALYFDHDPDRLAALATRAAAIGVERFVLDDGWFTGRDHDRAALGDWQVDRRKYPAGLTALIDHVHGLGMEFGLWVEPEMVNPDSALYRAHPDWVLGVAGHETPLARHQWVLDLTRTEVFDHIHGCLDRLLRDHAIDYLKWDMNRDVTHPGSRGHAAAGAQTRAVYRLIDRLRADHRRVEIESCASGGGRADYGILERCVRIWTSDSNDALERQRIQAGFSLFFPPEIMGAHIGPERAHTTARRLGLDFRAATALFGHLGLECDLLELSDTEQAALGAAIALHKRFRPLIHGGQVIRERLDDGRVAVFGALANDASEALLAYCALDRLPDGAPTPLRLTGLIADARYRVSWLTRPPADTHSMKSYPETLFDPGVVLPGAVLAQAGLQPPLLDPQSALLLHVRTVR